MTRLRTVFAVPALTLAATLGATLILAPLSPAHAEADLRYDMIDARPKAEAEPEKPARATRAPARTNSRAPASAARPANLHAIVARHASEHGIPVALADAVVQVESRYNPRATGRSGEVGLMQIKLQTARGVGFTGSRAQLYEPETNIRYGMKYLAGAHKIAGGSLCGTIARYQGGHYSRGISGANAAYCNRVKQIMGQSGREQVAAVNRS